MRDCSRSHSPTPPSEPLHVPGGPVVVGRRRADVRRIQFEYLVEAVIYMITPGTTGIHGRDDPAAVGLVDANQTTTRQDPPGEPSEKSHAW